MLSQANESDRFGLLLRDDGYVELIKFKPDDFCAQSLRSEKQVVGSVNILWSREVLFAPVNECASRLVKEKVHGDAVIVIQKPPQWLIAIDSRKLRTAEELLCIARCITGDDGVKRQSYPPHTTLRYLLHFIESSDSVTESNDYELPLSTCVNGPGMKGPVGPLHDGKAACEEERDGTPEKTTQPSTCSDGTPSYEGMSHTKSKMMCVTSLLVTGEANECPPGAHKRQCLGESGTLLHGQPQTPCAVCEGTEQVEGPGDDHLLTGKLGIPNNTQDAYVSLPSSPSCAMSIASFPTGNRISEPHTYWLQGQSGCLSYAVKESGDATVRMTHPPNAPPAEAIAENTEADEVPGDYLGTRATTQNMKTSDKIPCTQPPWDLLNNDVLQAVFGNLSCQDAVNASGVCRHWRSVILQDQTLLGRIHVSLNESRPFGHSSFSPSGMGLRVLARIDSLQLPRLVQVAADKAGNSSACMLCANLSELRRDLTAAATYWKKAAKASHPIAMFKLGHHLYKGDINNLGRCAEDAVKWLQRFQRVVGPLVETPPDARTGTGQPSSSEESPTASPSQLGIRSRATSISGHNSNSGFVHDREALKHMLSQALVILGYLHLDGEGTKKDNREAVSTMRRAAALGNDEADRTLGWMYNTGQFGD